MIAVLPPIPVPRRPYLRVVPDSTRSPIRRTKGSRMKPCRHRLIEVDPGERRVVCLECRSEVDPYEALDMLAQEIEQYNWAIDAARRESEKTRLELANLKRLEVNAKSRVRGAIKTFPPCACEPPKRYGRFCSTCGGRIPPRQ